MGLLRPGGHGIITTIRSSPVLLITSTFFSVYLFFLLTVVYSSSDDPTSIFFQPDSVKNERYSTFREAEALKFIDEIEQSAAKTTTEGGSPSLPSPTKFNSSLVDQSICVGIPSYTRFNSAPLFPTTIGSLLQGLSPEERSRVYLIPFISHTDPNVHPYYSKKWLSLLSDRTLDYTGLPTDQIRTLNKFEKSRLDDNGEKAVFDYIHLLQACVEVGSPHILIMEDDVLAMDGWYHRAQSAVSSWKSKPRGDEAYVRLFYAEESLGWKKSRVKFYISVTVIASCLTLIGMVIIRCHFPQARPYAGIRPALLAIFVFIPLTVALIFAAGRATVVTIIPGMQEMTNQPDHCTQSLLYARQTVLSLIRWLSYHKTGRVDELIEQYADQTQGRRYSIVPAIMQHIGRRLADPSVDWDRQLWNFGFERFRPSILHLEHTREAIALLKSSATGMTRSKGNYW